MQTIALVSRKGGTGKSTLAVGLAVAAMEAGHKVCLLEADPLGTVSNWRRRRTTTEPSVESIHDGYALFHRVQALAQRGFTLTIVDTAGGWSDASTGAMAAADLCLIPTRPSPADIDAAAPTLAAVRESRKPFAFVLNQVQARTTRLNGAAGSLGKRAIELNMSHVLALPAIVLRNDQQDALGLGLGVTEYARVVVPNCLAVAANVRGAAMSCRRLARTLPATPVRNERSAKSSSHSLTTAA
jgi:chromosome partitioning protein